MPPQICTYAFEYLRINETIGINVDSFERTYFSFNFLSEIFL